MVMVGFDFDYYVGILSNKGRTGTLPCRMVVIESEFHHNRVFTMVMIITILITSRGQVCMVLCTPSFVVVVQMASISAS